jgi:hypothetical protein
MEYSLPCLKMATELTGAFSERNRYFIFITMGTARNFSRGGGVGEPVFQGRGSQKFRLQSYV